MTPDRLPADQAVRDRVTNDFDTTFLLEARAPIDRIVAITFTDKAAGELKLRLRDDIEKAIEKATGEEKGRLQKAADDLERAPVSTIHSFALGLLRERPFEAGLDPGISVAAEVASDRTFDDAWEAWLEDRMSEGNPVLVRAMTCDLELQDLREAARTIVNERDILGREEKAPPFDPHSLLSRLVRVVGAPIVGCEASC